jgi:hypothetical protein
MGTKKIRLIWAALLGLSRVLPAAATDYQASDYLPLAVGNSWTYQHIYHDIHDPRAKEKWSTYIAQRPEIPQFTIEVLRTEVIAGKTYYVISDMPANWPPAPPHFIAGKKLRWQGTHLMERITDGERAVFRFDGANDAGYAIEPVEGDNVVEVTVYSNPNPRHYIFRFRGSEGRRSCGFFKNYGLTRCAWIITRSPQIVFNNRLDPIRAVLGGRTVGLDDLLMPTSTSPSSWGQVKKEVH